MTDKIMINNVDVSGCEFLNYDDELKCETCNLSDFNNRYECKNNPNCRYKQLKRKEEECEKTKKQLEDLQKSYSKLFQRYENKGWSKEYDELEQQLQAEKEKVEVLEKRFKTSENWRIRAEDINEKFSLKVDIYKQALEEIKEIAKTCNNSDACCDCKYCDDCEIKNVEPLTYDICQLILKKFEVLND